ncbi:MAG: response regulator [Luteibaculum sp.]
MDSKVFFVDDDEVTLFLYKRLAKKLDIDSEFCENGQVLLDALESTNSGVIVLDINMPVLNGIEAVKELDKKGTLHQYTVLAMLGTSNMDTVKHQLEEFGISNFIEKPLKESTLRLLLEQGVN